MNAGHYFRIGSTHRICQDYALSFAKDDRACAIVSDGCSSSRDTDFGSRILSRVCASNVWDLEPMFEIPFIREAHEQADSLGLPTEALDATVLWALVTEKSYQIRMYGDGVVVKTRKDGCIEIVQVEFSSGAPYYLSYHLSDERNKGYKLLFGDVPPIVRKTLVSSKGEVMSSEVDKTQTKLDPVAYEEDGTNSYSQYTNIVLMSDGALSFLEAVNTGTSKSHEPVPLHEMINSLLPFKNYQGDFVERRVQRFIKDCEKAGWQHFDDFSIAAIHIGD